MVVVTYTNGHVPLGPAVYLLLVEIVSDGFDAVTVKLLDAIHEDPSCIND